MTPGHRVHVPSRYGRHEEHFCTCCISVQGGLILLLLRQLPNESNEVLINVQKRRRRTFILLFYCSAIEIFQIGMPLKEEYAFRRRKNSKGKRRVMNNQPTLVGNSAVIVRVVYYVLSLKTNMFVSCHMPKYKSQGRQVGFCFFLLITFNQKTKLMHF